MKVKLIANAHYDNMTYMRDKEYVIDKLVYENIKRSCIIIEQTATDIEQNNYTKQPKKILFIKKNGVGNIIMGTPTILKLKELFDCEIDLLVDEGYVNVLETWKNLSRIYDSLDKCIDKEYDLVIVGIPGAIKEQRLIDRWGNRVIFGNHEMLKIYHEVEANINLLCALGWDGSNIPDMYILEKEVKLPGKSMIAITAGFGKNHEQWEHKNWGYENYAELINKLRIKYKTYKFVLLGVAGEGKIIDYLNSKKNVIDCTGKYTLHETAYIIRHCKFLVCNDTGLMHVAAAVGTEVYAVFGGTLKKKNYPWNCKSHILQSNRECVPCFYTRRWKECEKPYCLKDITPDDVIQCILSRKKYDIGIVIPVGERYTILQTTLRSLAACHDSGDRLRFVFIDDHTKDDKIKIAIDQFREAMENKNHEVLHLKNIVNYGKEYFAQVQKQGYNLIRDCEYMFYMPDDALVNPYLFQVLKKAKQYISVKYNLITFFKDQRIEKKLYAPIDEYDEYFDIVTHTDGFLLFGKTEFFDKIIWRNKPKEWGSCFWIEVKIQLMEKEKHYQLRFKESLAEHTGNIISALNSNIRKQQPFFAVDLNLHCKPKFLEG